MVLREEYAWQGKTTCTSLHHSLSSSLSVLFYLPPSFSLSLSLSFSLCLSLYVFKYQSDSQKAADNIPYPSALLMCLPPHTPVHSLPRQRERHVKNSRLLLSPFPSHLNWLPSLSPPPWTESLEQHKHKSNIHTPKCYRMAVKCH